MDQWSFITNHGRVLLYVASHPDARLRDLAAALVTDLVQAGYVIKERDGRRNRYQIQDHLPLRDTVGRERTIGEVLDLLAERQDIPDEPSVPVASTSRS